MRPLRLAAKLQGLGLELGQQLWERNSALCLLHLTDPDALLAAWRASPSQDRAPMAIRRPLLRALDTSPPLEKLGVERLLALERLVWERVNEQRHGRYTRAWKDFYRQWRHEENWEWPTSEQFWLQHRRLARAARAHGLPPNPLANVRSEELVEAALRETAKVGRASQNEIGKVLPPVDELLPCDSSRSR